DLERAIAIAQRVPYGTTGYNAAQAQIKTWQDFLAPPPPIDRQPVEEERETTLE
ncbi:MAG: hypothetical protein F6K35_48750, partial [Okeania sp. SIO2H7]|nr:hypothetical protein [Okeania sp. SIO2H7]